MAELTVSSISRAGIPLPTKVAAGASGDTFFNDGVTMLWCFNAHVSETRTITVDAKRNCDQGFDHDVVVVVPANTQRMIGPFPKSWFNGNAGLVDVSYSDSGADFSLVPLSSA